MGWCAGLFQLRSRSLSSFLYRTCDRELKGKYFSTSQNVENRIKDIESLFNTSDDVKVKSTKEELTQFNTDWTGNFPGYSHIVVLPGTSQGTSKLLQYCNKEKIGVVPQGGNTGLVGGTAATEDEVVISMKRMNRILSFDKFNGILQCEAGCILGDLESYLNERDYIFPLDLGASGSCCVGGNVSTNAGGLRFIRYGSLKGTLLGMEVITPDGTILDMMGSLRKDNTGYDMKQLFIGAEGTLGIITKLAFDVKPYPSSRNVVLLGMNSFEVLPSCIMHAKKLLGETLYAVEFWDNNCMDLVVKGLGISDPFEDLFRFYLLLENAGTDPRHDNEKMEKFVGYAFEQGLAENAKGVQAQNKEQMASLFRIRESITVALRESGKHVYKYDVSLPSILKINETTCYIREILEEKYQGITVVQFGHLGDCNLHLNIMAGQHCPELQKNLEDELYGFLSRSHGSISAEHGIGVLKRDKLKDVKSPAVIAYMNRIKNLFDPNCIMNPGKVL